MKFKNYIQEEINERMVISFKKVKRPTIELYANPTGVEMRNVFRQYQGARFVLDYKNKIIYLWPANYFHAEVVPELKNHLQNNKYREDFNDDNRGRALNLSGNKLSKINLDKEIPEGELKWVSEYLNLSDVEYMEVK
jgi:hypothetical protein